jgi:hypothetical protein
MGVVKRVFREIEANGVVCSNVLFIELNVKRLKELAYFKEGENNEEKASAEVCENNTEV